MVAHGLITGMLFFLAGSVKERYHTLEIARLGGMLKQMPRLGWILGFCAMASLGLPGLAGFWGEFPAILSSYQPAEGLPVETFRTFMVVAAIGTVLAAGYLLWLYQRTAFGEPREEFSGGGDDVHDRHGHGVHDGHGHVAHSVSAAAHDERDDGIHDVNIYEWIAWTPMLVAILVLGVYPQLLFEIIDPAVNVALKAF
jgi:NADH-quinone oxidoreductase subunit M